MGYNDGFDDDTLTEAEIDQYIGADEIKAQDSFYDIKDKLDSEFASVIKNIVGVREQLDTLVFKLEEDAVEFAQQNSLDVDEVRLVVSQYKEMNGTL